MKSKLPVVWSNVKAWVTQQFFAKWMHEVFAPSVKKCLREKGLPLIFLLLHDNAPALVPVLSEGLFKKIDFIEVNFLPLNTTPILQPIVQQVLKNNNNCTL